MHLYLCVFYILKPLIPGYILFTFSGKTVGMRQGNIGGEMGAAGERLTNWRHLERGGIAGGCEGNIWGRGAQCERGGDSERGECGWGERDWDSNGRRREVIVL